MTVELVEGTYDLRVSGNIVENPVEAAAFNLTLALPSRL